MNTDLVTLMCGAKYLQFNNDESVEVNPFILTYSRTYVDEWKSDDRVMSYFGLISTLDYSDNPYFVTRNSRNNLFTWFKATTLNGVMELSRLHLESVISSLWFIKDHSINLSILYGYDPGLEGALYKLQMQSYSNCIGQYQDTVFNQIEMVEAARLGKRLDELSDFQIIDASEVENEDGHGVIKPAALNIKQYNNHNRIARAYLFLTMARSKSFLPLKISFYIAIYESLFTTDANEVSHKVTERAVLYLGGSRDEKRRIFKIIKKAYAVRSKYLHGQELPKDMNTVPKLSDLSKSIDTITRELFSKILDKNGSVFLKKDEELNEWFTEMLIGD